MEVEVSFGLWLQKRRKALDLTREELAQKIGCSVSALRKIETDERHPSKQLAELLACALNIPEDERPAFVRIVRGELSLAQLQFQPLLPNLNLFQSPNAFSKHIPIPPTPLVGREIELATLRQMLSDSQCRLITLVGPGGSGKTRLAMEIALERRADVALVLLASVNSSSMLVPAIAEAVGFTFYGSMDPKVQLLNYLREKHLLLVLDNMEHLMDGADLIAEILHFAPHLKLLCTSREPFNLRGEWVFEVGGLNFPKGEAAERAENYSAAALFVQCAQRVKTGFTLTAEDLSMVTRICTMVDGMPLAIELAAAWVRTLSCREIAHEIEHNLDILFTSARDMPERHHSIQAVFDHSWNLLSEQECQVLARLSVFRGGFTRLAAEQVTGASLAILSSLVSKSLVRRNDAEGYNLHDILHQYAAAHLEADPQASRTIRERHYTFYLQLAETADSQLRGSGQLDWLSRLEQELDNLRAALDWSLGDNGKEPATHRDSAVRLAGALRWFWQIRGYFHEGCIWLMKALDLDQSKLGATAWIHSLTSLENTSSSENVRSQARALEGLALLTNSLGNHTAAYTLAEQSMAIYQQLGDRQGMADALMILGQTLLWQGKAILGDSHLAEALALYRELGDQWNVARSLYRLGSHLADSGGDVAGRAMLEESSTILEGLGDKFLFISVLVSRGVIALTAGDFTEARSHFDRSLAIAREIGDPWETADALTNIGCILRIQGDFSAASSLFEEALRIYQKGGRGIWCADPLCALAENEITQGNLSAARLHLQAALAHAESSENTWLQTLIGYFQGLLAYYEGDMARAAVLLEKTVDLARESQYKPDLARSLVSLGQVMCAQGQFKRAETLFREGLQLFYDMDSKLGIATALEGFAAISLTRNVEQAAHLFGSVDALRAAIGAPIAPVDYPGYERDVALVKAQLGEASFTEVWAAGYSEPYRKTILEILATSDSDLQITSKLFIPPLRPSLVPRPSLVQLLSEGLSTKRKMTLVSAPAGFGKTTLVVDWLKQIDVPVAWLSLDEADNDLPRFLAYLGAAFQQVDEEIGVSLRSALQSPQLPAMEKLLTGLLNEIAVRTDPLILVLDDYHLLTEAAILEVMGFLLAHQPQQLHLVLTTREDPDLPLAKLRARDQLNEIRARDLRFTQGEADVFLRSVMGLALSEQDVAALEGRTEGWVVGLQLAGLSMQKQADLKSFIADFSGSHRHILDYLTDEVLQQQPEDVRMFLLQTAILDRLSGPLCDALTGRMDSDRLLAHLEAANLFVIPLDDERHWYRYHHLFSDLLRNQLARSQPELVPELQRRASRWYEENGDIQAAIDHALQDTDFTQAARLIEQHALPKLYQGEVTTVVGWFNRLPEAILQSAPMLCIGKAWALAVMQPGTRMREVERALQAADQALHQVKADETLRALVAGHMASIRAYLLHSSALSDRKPEKWIALSQEAQQLLPVEEKGVRSVNAMNIGFGYMALGDLEAASLAFKQTLEDGISGGNLYAAIYGPFNLVLIALLMGHLSEALQLCETYIERFNQIKAGQNFPSIGVLYILKGSILLEYDHLAEAEQALTEGLDLIRWTGESAAHIKGYTALARLRAIQGDRSAMSEAVKTLEENWPNGTLYAQALRHRLSIHHWPDDPDVRKDAQIWLNQSGIEFGELAEIDSAYPVNTINFESYLNAAHVLARLAKGKPGIYPVGDVHAYLKRRQDFAVSHGFVSWVVAAAIVRTLLYLAGGKKEEALQTLEVALSAAAPTGLFRIFLDEGEPLQALLKELKPRLTDDAVIVYANRLLEAFSGGPAKPETGDKHEALLSERELEVLQNLAKGLSYEEIGRQLFLSLNTVQSHVKNIYRKLLVNKRVQAIEKAREMNLI